MSEDAQAGGKRGHPSPSEESQVEPAKQPKPSAVASGWVLSVKIVFGSAAEREIFVGMFRPLAEWVAQNEPNTLSYELLLSDKEETTACIFERYASKSDFVAHQQSEPVKAFKAAVAKAESEGSIHRVSVDGHSFNESAVGYMQR